jgi:hypothetical protein
MTTNYSDDDDNMFCGQNEEIFYTAEGDLHRNNHALKGFGTEPHNFHVGNPE